MTAAIMSSKGQITIPLSVREAMKVRQGDRVEFVEVAPGRFEVMAANRSIKDLKFRFRATKHVTIDDMNDAISAAGAAAGGL